MSAEVRESATTRKATGEETIAFQQRVSDAVREHTEEVSRLALEGDVAVLVLNPIKDCRQFAIEVGWDGKTDPAVFRMSRGSRRRLARADTVTAAWLHGNQPGRVRIFLITERANFLLNHGPCGFYFEPGSLDSERA